MAPLEQAGQLETAPILSFLTAALRFLALWGDFFALSSARQISLQNSPTAVVLD